MYNISIVLPVYNVEDYLRECLDSILLQSYTNFELLCINDGSNDSSLDILLEYKNRDKRVKIITQENKGLSIARNVGIRNATGEYICFVDSDDTLVPEALCVLNDAIERNQCQIITYENNVIYENSELLKKENKDAYYYVSNDYSQVEKGRKLFSKKIMNNDYVESAWLMLINRDWLMNQKIEFEPGALFEDSVFSLECYFRCDSMKHIKKKLYNYRVRQNSIMTQKFTYKHAYYRLWQIKECFRIYYSYTENDDEKIAVAKYALQCATSARDVYDKINLVDKQKVLELSSLEGVFVKLMGFDNSYNNYNDKFELMGFFEYVKKYNRIIIYGAGVVGNKVLYWLKINKLQNKVIGFAVSDKNKIQDDSKIKCIGEYTTDDDVLVIIAARESFHKEMLNNVCKRGFKEYCFITHSIEQQIDLEIKGENNA